MALDDDIRALSRVELFAEFSQDQLRLLAFGAETLRFAPGRELYREGNLADSAYVVVSGDVELYRDKNGVRAVVGSAGEGAILGGFALIAETRRATGAAASIQTEAIRLNRKLFRRILEEYPETAAALYGQLADEFHAMVAEIEKMEQMFDD